jgi:hypothetical protein
VDIREILDRHEKETQRYFGIALSNVNPHVLTDIKNQLLQCLSPTELWIAPGEDQAPLVPVSRVQFCIEVFGKPHPNGLIVFMPDQWMFNWTKNDRAVFWAQLAETYGQNRIYVVFGETPSIVQFASTYLTRVTTAAQQVSVWTSKRER